MASRSTGPSASRLNVYETSSGGSRPSRPQTATTQKGKGISKADRILGVVETAQPAVSRPYAPSPTARKFQKKGFASAFADLKAGALSVTARYGSRGRRTPTSPGMGTVDSESMSSMTSPTFNTSASTSTLPSYHEQPASPRFSHLGSESPTSARDTDGRWDYHATLKPGKYKGITDMPSISESYDPQGNTVFELPPLEKPLLSAASKPGTPKTIASFSPINRLRSPSNLSVASEATAKAKLFGRRSSKRYTKDSYVDYPSTPSTEHYQPEAYPPVPPLPPNRQDSSAIEQWLAGAELERRPSLSSTITGSTYHRRDRLAPSANSSQVSVKTLTSANEAAFPANHRKKDQLRPMKSEGALKSTRKAGFRKNKGADLYLQSVLSLSSSEDESEPDNDDTIKASETTVVFDNTESTPKQSQRTSSFASSSTSAPQFLQMQREVILGQGQPKRRSKRQRAVPIEVTATPFSAVAWQGGDESELAAMCAAATEKACGPEGGLQKTSGPRKVDSMLLSPTSRMMVVSKKEEKLLAQIRDRQSYDGKDASGAKSSTTEGDDSTNSPATSAAPAIMLHSSKSATTADGRLRASESESVSSFHVDEAAVINFPAPPSSSLCSKPGLPRHRPYSLSLSLSREALNEMSTLPEVAYGSTDGHGNESVPAIPPLPTGELLKGDRFSGKVSRERLVSTNGMFTPDAGSYMSPNYSVSDLTASGPQSRSQSSFFNFATQEVGVGRLQELHKPVLLQASELQGSMPEPKKVLTAEEKHGKQKNRASSTMVYTTGLEGKGSDGDGFESDYDDDLANYVMSSVL